MITKRNFVGLAIIALARAAAVSAQAPTFQGALVISRVSFPPLSTAKRSLLRIKYSLREQRKVPDIPKWVCATSQLPLPLLFCHPRKIKQATDWRSCLLLGWSVAMLSCSCIRPAAVCLTGDSLHGCLLVGTWPQLVESSNPLRCYRHLWPP
jgi:hypothetical protein